MKPYAIILMLILGPRVLAQDIFTKTDTQTEIELGRSTWDAYTKYAGIVVDSAANQRVARLLSALKKGMSNTPYPFEFRIIDDNNFNASCFPGGFFAINIGFLEMCTSDESAAFVLGHEMGHAVHRHWAGEMRKIQGQRINEILDSLAGTRTAQGSEAFNLGMLRFNRGQETQADHFGTEIYLRAGFNPLLVAEGAKIIANLEQGNDTPLYLRSHPPGPARVEFVQKTTESLLSVGVAPVASTSVKVDEVLRDVFGELPPIGGAENPYFPMRTGATWVYSVRKGLAFETQYEVSCQSVFNVGGNILGRFELLVGAEPVKYQCATDSMRIFRRNRPESKSSKWKTEHVIPQFDGSEAEDGKLFARSSAGSVEVPAGTFKECILIETYVGTEKKMQSWFSQEVGLVKRVTLPSGEEEVLVSMRGLK